ncbi:MAG: hypothetical protein GY874_09600 [Desulfobacteraceae bacterium]|nr:hypothetical protein [Desulfobacteraceae bacterium]
MTLNFMRAAGLDFLITGLSIFYILIFAFTNAEQWSKWALVSIVLTQSIIMGAVIFSVRAHTPAIPPLAPFMISAILSIIGLFTYRGANTIMEN